MYLKLVLALACFVGGWTVNGWRKDVQIAEAKSETQTIKREYLEKYTRDLQAARDKEQSLQTQLKKANDGHVQRQNILLADASRANDISNRLRDELAAIKRSLPDLTSETLRRYTEAFGIIFGECQARYGAVAQDAQRNLNAAQTLDEAWPQ